MVGTPANPDSPNEEKRIQSVVGGANEANAMIKAGRMVASRGVRIAALVALLALALYLTLRSGDGAEARPPADSAPRIESDGDFDQLARTDGAGRYFAQPQVKFANDRSATPARVRWINTKRFVYHFYFLQANYQTLADLETFNAANYSQPDRRFVLGSVVRYPRLKRYGVELWEGDFIEPSLLAATMQQLQAAFHSPLTFKPNSEQQLAAAKEAGLPTIGIDEAYGGREQMVLNNGRAVGRLVVVEEGGEDALMPGDIALLKTIPIRIPPVAGIVSSNFTTPINHVSLLAKTWRIPNAYRADAEKIWGKLDGKQVVYEAAGSKGVTIRLATPAEIKTAEAIRASTGIRAPKVDPVYSGLPSLAEQDAHWSVRTGAKAANLAEVAALARDKPSAGFAVPPGFSVPFAFYDRYVAANGLAADIEALL
jgi:hypothetical protein